MVTPSATSSSGLPGNLAILALAGIGGAGLVAMVKLLHINEQTWWVCAILLAAVVVILVLLLAYRLLLGWLRSRKANPFARSLAQAAGSTPNAISALASRAKLDDLRRNFEEGIRKFHAAGKDLYRLPWYLLIGEPGSGKTEAVRHSGIPFPPGLQDQLQGVGGTVNMNWWFTHDAIILDTAGRYLFDEVQPGASSEWTEFLRLLAENRPQCPINGLLLVIPADSLIKDTADKIEAKANKIAQQLDRIQRTLDVRFPVYVVVTKCDLINGFREFFDGLGDQRQTGQILGWSNPASLDEPFDPDRVDEHLRQVRERLTERKMGLLLDPVAREGTDAKRIDEVDALYSLPDSFVRIGPRLRQYLEMVFVAGEWSPKPLFLRGIYFTSSMREGQALDAELAELLGVPVDSLSENKLWDRDRAFFLRDLFLKKVFPENGLVTRAASANVVERNRKVALLAAGFAGALALLGFTYVGARQLDGSVRAQADELGSLRDVNFAIVAPAEGGGGGGGAAGIGATAARPPTAPVAPVYVGRLAQKETKGVHAGKPLGELHDLLIKRQADAVHVPVVLAPAAGLIDRGVASKNLNDQKHEVYRAIYTSSVLQPLAQAVGQRLRTERKEGTWSEVAGQALEALIRMRTGKPQPDDLRSMYVYVARSPADTDAYVKYGPTLERGLALAMPNDALSEPVNVKDDDLRTGIEAFIAYWDAKVKAQTQTFANLAGGGGETDVLQRALEGLGLACDAIRANPPMRTVDYRAHLENWKTRWAAYDAAYVSLNNRLNELAAAGGNGGPVTSLADMYRAAQEAAADRAAGEYAKLLSAFPAPSAAVSAAMDKLRDATKIDLRKSDPQDPRTMLESARNQLRDRTRSDAVVAGLKRFDDSLFKKPIVATATTGPAADTPPPEAPYVVIHSFYEAVNQVLPGFADGPAPAATAAAEGSAGPTTKDLEAAHSLADKDVAALPGQTLDDRKTRARVARNADVLLDLLAAPKVNTLSLTRRLAAARQSIDDLVAQRFKQAGGEAPTFKRIPLSALATNRVVEANLNADAAAQVLKEQRDLVKEILANADKTVQTREGAVHYVLDGEALRDSANARQSDVRSYVKSYVEYYNQNLTDIDSVQLPAGATWAILLGNNLSDVVAPVLNASLEHDGQLVADSLAKVLVDGEKSTDLTAGLNAAKEGVKAVQTRGTEFGAILRKWKDLTPGAAAARQAVLALKAEDFNKDYIVHEGISPDFATVYWTRLTMALLRTLATVEDESAKDALSLARKPEMRKFPLSLNAVAPLTQAQIDAVRAPLNKTTDRKLPPSDPKEIIAMRAAKNAIGDGGRVDEGVNAEMREINGQLERLSAGGLSDKDWQSIAALRTLLDALPRVGDRYKCEASIPPRAEQPAARRFPLLGSQFRAAQIEGNGALMGNAVDLPPPAGAQGGGPLDTVLYPMALTNGPLRVDLFRQFGGRLPPDASILPAPLPGAQKPDPNDEWQLLRFITAPGSVRSKDGTTWDVELVQSVNGKPYAVWARFKFERPIPPLAAWPQ